MSNDQDAPPIPDPTSLTTDALHREIGRLQEILETKLDAEHAFCEERFNAVDSQLEMTEQRRTESKFDSEKAVSAALDAAKEAVSKSEVATDKRLNEVGKAVEKAEEGTRRDLDDLKNRVTVLETGKIERRSQAWEQREVKQGTTANLGVIGAYAFGTLMFVVGVAAIVVANS